MEQEAIIPFQSLNILLVDDDPDLRDILREYLELAGATVYPAESGERAAEIFLAADRVDLIISDNYMPGMGGMELLRHLQASARLVPPFILVSGSTDEVNEQSEGVSRVVSKPFDIDLLMSAAASAVGRAHLV